MRKLVFVVCVILMSTIAVSGCVTVPTYKPVTSYEINGHQVYLGLSPDDVKEMLGTPHNVMKMQPIVATPMADMLLGETPQKPLLQWSYKFGDTEYLIYFDEGVVSHMAVQKKASE